jgi:hypothetical protein
VDNIKIDLREIGWNGMDWIDLAQDRDHGGFPRPLISVFYTGAATFSFK